MYAASKNTYVSKQFMAKYKDQKEQTQSKKVEKPISATNDVQNQSQRGRNRSRSRSRSRRMSRSRSRSCEVIHSDDLENELNHSDEEMPEMKKKRKVKARKKPAQIYKQEVDTNVFKINMTTLKDGVEMASGDPTFCTNCLAVFNMYSKAEDNKESGNEGQVWQCEFCNTKQEVNFEPEELPKSKAVNYILEAAAQVHEKKMVGKQEISVVFCIDISGSMCVSQPIVGKHSIKGDRTGGLKDLMKFSDGSDQRMDGEKNVTYVSRMQCVQAAIDSQLAEMAVGAPDRKIGIVSFNHEVTIIGDGTKTEQIITGDKLYDYDYLIQNGQSEGSARLQQSIKDTKTVLQQKLMNLDETGPTALGPALLTAIAMAAEGAPGSTVVLCTDGLANVGLGGFDEITTEEQSKKIDEFYESLGEFAKNKGLTVSIISIEGEECNIDTLSKISEMTGGNVERVNPIQLTQNFANILALPVIATNVVTKVKLHKGLEFRNEDVNNLSEDKTILVKQLGNVTEETEITFEYRLKSIKDLVKMDDIDLSLIKSFPFQAQITYHALDGSKCIRVITNQQSISNDREELEKNANYEILSTNAIQQSSKLAKKGQMREAQAYAKSWNRKMRSQMNNEEQVECYQQYNKHFGGVYNMIQEAQDEDEEMMVGSAALQGEEESKKPEPKTEKSKGMFGKLGDKISTKLYQASKMSKNTFSKK